MQAEGPIATSHQLLNYTKRLWPVPVEALSFGICEEADLVVMGPAPP